MLEDEDNISREDSGSDKDWGPARDQEDSTDSDDDELDNNNEERVMTSGSSGNREGRSSSIHGSSC